MSIVKLYVGVDMSKKNFVAYAEAELADRSTKRMGKRVFDNNSSGLDAFVEWLSKRNPTRVDVHVGMEATGNYHEPLAYLLDELQIPLSVILPNLIKHFGRSLNEYSKTDWIDARLIAAYVRMHQPEIWQPANPSMRSLRYYTRERQWVVDSKHQASNRLHALRHAKYPEATTIQRLEEQIELFDAQITEIEATIERLCAHDDKLDQDVKLLTSIPHVGLITATVILAETGGFVLFKNRNQLIKYAGMDIIEKQSGSSINGKARWSKRGNAHLRTAPYMSALGVPQGETVFEQTYQRHMDSHGIKTKARAAVMRQLLKVAYGVFKSRQAYDPKVHQNRALNEVGELNGSPTVTHSVP